NTRNPLYRCSTFALFTLLALGSVACGAAPGDATNVEESPAGIAMPPLTDTSSLQSEDDAAADSQPSEKSAESTDPTPVETVSPGWRPAGGYLPAHATPAR